MAAASVKMPGTDSSASQSSPGSTCPGGSGCCTELGCGKTVPLPLEAPTSLGCRAPGVPWLVGVLSSPCSHLYLATSPGLCVWTPPSGCSFTVRPNLLCRCLDLTVSHLNNSRCAEV